MKRMKSLLAMVLALCMLLSVCPLQVLAANVDTGLTPDEDDLYVYTAEIKDYTSFLAALKLLEGYAKDYSAATPGKHPLDLVLKFIRTGAEDYTTGFWADAAGYEDAGFAYYVRKQEAQYNAANPTSPINVTGLKNLSVFKAANGDVDMARLFAVLDAALSQDNENWADAAGWAGSIVELMALADSKGLTGDTAALVKEIQETLFLRSFDGKYDYSLEDYYADMDAAALADQLADYASGDLYEAISAYYTATTTDVPRAAYMIETRLGGITNRDDLRTALFQRYTSNAVAAQLENGISFKTRDLADLRTACCYVLADELCRLAGDHIIPGENRYYSLVSSDKKTLAPGITQEICKAITSDDKQIVYYLATADVNLSTVNVYANYKDNDPSKGWGMQSVRDQVAAAEARHSNPATSNYIPNYQVIASVNGAGYNMTTGEPGGLLIMGGKEYHAPDGNGYFGILKDGSASIGTTAEYYELKSQGLIMEGISIFGTTLVKDGKLAVGHDAGHIHARASRTAVGITKTGKVVFMVLDGRQEPVSCGGSMQEIAQIMLEAGCVDAVNMDGGGSTTFMAQQPGDTDVSLVNNPSDGFERKVSTSLIMVSTAPVAETLERVELTSSVEYLTPGAEVAVSATGISTSGNIMNLPTDAKWSVSDTSVAAISNDGVVTGLKNGQVEVKLTQGTKVLGTLRLTVVTPDAVAFSQEYIAVKKGASVDLPVEVSYKGKAVAFLTGDVTITLGNSTAGTIKGFRFTAAADTSLNTVSVTATVTKNSAATDTVTLVLQSADGTAFAYDEAYGDRELAWLRTVSNAKAQDGNYICTNTAVPMDAAYTFALDLTNFPIDQEIQALVYEQLHISADAESPLLLQAARKVGSQSQVQLKITFQDALNPATSGIKVHSPFFTLRSASVDAATNTLAVVLGWKPQSSDVDLKNCDSICIISGITAKTGTDSWTGGNRIAIVNSAQLSWDIIVQGDALYNFAETDATQGIAPYENSGIKGGRIAAEGKLYTDRFSLINGNKNGWFYEEGGYAFYENGTRYTGVRKAGEFYYDFGASGINQGQTKYSGLFMDGSKRCYAKDGVLTSGWYIEGDKHYYFDENGVGYHGKVMIDEVETEFDNGLQVGGLTDFVKKSDGYTYHYTNGIKDYGWVYVGEDLYHFSTNTGTMTTGTHVIPDEEASAKGAYYDFAPDGRTLRGYFNGFGYYYWAGDPAINKWVKNGADPDPDAWYRTNTHGHYVCDTTGKETYNLTIDGKTYRAVKIAVDGVVYVFDTTNGKLLQGGFRYVDAKWYWYWAGKAYNEGWLEVEGKTYYAHPDGHLAVGSLTVDGETYFFNSKGELVTGGTQLLARVTEDGTTMHVTLKGLTSNPARVKVGIWAQGVGQSTLQWLELKKNSEGNWTGSIGMCLFGVDAPDTYALHAYEVAAPDVYLLGSTAEVFTVGNHTYKHEYDPSCEACGATREVDMTRPMVDMFRMYNPNTGEHFYTGSAEERDNLIGYGWQYEGVGFTFPLTTGDPVYRLFQPSTGEHLYTMDKTEKTLLESQGWNYEGIAFNSGFENEVPQYRLHNPNATVGAYHFTASQEEMDVLRAAGWEYQGIGWYSLGAMP